MKDQQLIIDDRGSGRTTKLIHWASEEQPPPAPMRYIVCHSQSECSRVFREAVDIGMPIAFPVTWEEMLAMQSLKRDVEFSIDNLSLILSQMVPGPIKLVVW